MTVPSAPPAEPPSSNAPTLTTASRSLVTGATGLVGRALLATLGDAAVATTRDPARAHGLAGTVVGWDARSTLPAAAFAGVGTIYHLAGEPVAEGRWTSEKRERIRASRIESTRALVDSIAVLASSDRPRVLVSASAVGIYGSRGDERLDEDAPGATGFLADVCRAWEAEASRAREFGVRVVMIRIGVVLAPSGGALAKMLVPFRLGLGARLGDGRQWMPWVHLDDVVALLRFAAEHDDLEGPVNAAAPGVVTNLQFTRALGYALHRPTIFVAPKFVLSLLFGDVADVVLASQRVIPTRALGAGFRFQYETLEGALAACVAPGGR